MANLDGPKFEKFKSKKRCRKDRFRTEFDAKKKASLLGLRAYFCSACYGYHLTSQMVPRS